MRLGSLILTCVLMVGLCGCGNKVKQTKEDAEVAAVVAERWIRTAQSLGVEADINMTYNGKGGGQVMAGGFQYDTGVAASAHMRVNPMLALDKTPVGPPPWTPSGNQGAKPPADPKANGSLTPLEPK